MSKLIKLEWHNEKRLPKDLVPCKQNPNTNTDVQFCKLKKSISTTGYVEPIVIDIDGTIIAGEHRWRALIALKKDKSEIDVRVPNRKLSQDEFDRYLIASYVHKPNWKMITRVSMLNVDSGLDVKWD